MADKKKILAAVGCSLGCLTIVALIVTALVFTGVLALGGGGAAWYMLSRPDPVEGVEEIELPPPEVAPPPPPPPVEAIPPPPPPEERPARDDKPPPPEERPPKEERPAREDRPPREEPKPRPGTEASASPSAGGAAPVTVRGPAKVTLIKGSDRYALPATVPAGRYTIEATFPGESPVEVGSVTISAEGGETITCNPKMGICRGGR